MAIIKQAKNIDIKVKNDYILIVEGKMEKIANQMNIETTENDLTIYSSKNIKVKGNIK